ncbi:hypothetical protein B0A49_13334, partial [Cryomyces minteri]
LLAPGEPCHTRPVRWCPLQGCDYAAKAEHAVKKTGGKRAVVGAILDLDDPSVGAEDEEVGIEARDAAPGPYPMLQSKMCLGSPQLLAPGEPCHTHPVRWCPLQGCDYTAKTEHPVKKMLGTRDDAQDYEIELGAGDAVEITKEDLQERVDTTAAAAAAAAQDYEVELTGDDATEITREDLQKRDAGLLEVSKVAGFLASLKANFAKGRKHAA